MAKKTAKKKAKKKVNRKKRFFVAESDREIHLVEADFFDKIGSRYIALLVGVNAYRELHRVLLEDVIEDGTLTIGTMKVTTGLTRTLDELNKRWPCIDIEIRSIGNNYGSQPIYVS